MSLPYFPFYASDHHAKTSHLSIAEHGALTRLLAVMWMTPGCSVPDDGEWLARRLNVNSIEMDAIVWPVIADFCQRQNGRIYSKRLSEEHEKAVAAHKRRSDAGKKGVHVRLMKTNGKGVSNA